MTHGTAGTDARAVAARLEFERVVDEVERVDPATSGRLRLEAVALGRDLGSGRTTPAAYAEQVAALSTQLHAALDRVSRETREVPVNTAPLAAWHGR